MKVKVTIRGLCLQSLCFSIYYFLNWNPPLFWSAWWRMPHGQIPYLCTFSSSKVKDASFSSPFSLQPPKAGASVLSTYHHHHHQFLHFSSVKEEFIWMLRLRKALSFRLICPSSLPVVSTSRAQDRPSSGWSWSWAEWGRFHPRWRWWEGRGGLGREGGAPDPSHNPNHNLSYHLTS